jgi:phage terminase small subunit
MRTTGQKNMTPKQTRFIDEYLIDLNATQAAIRAGYSKKTARQMGTENLSKPYIKVELEKR